MATVVLEGFSQCTYFALIAHFPCDTCYIVGIFIHALSPSQWYTFVAYYLVCVKLVEKGQRGFWSSP